MSPVIACQHGPWPARECLQCAPNLLTPTVPPADDHGGLTLDGPPVVVTIAVGAVSVMAVIVIAGVAVATWAVGAVIDAIRGDA